MDPPREDGDPFEKGISEAEMARRFNGKKIISRHHQGAWGGEVMCRCVLFSRYIPRVGASGQGLVQFWGPRADRHRHGSGDWSKWTVGKARLNTVDVSTMVFSKRK